MSAFEKAWAHKSFVDILYSVDDNFCQLIADPSIIALHSETYNAKLFAENFK